MKGKDLIKIVFTHPYINKKGWVFEAETEDMDIELDDDDDYIDWLGGTWKNGHWHNGQWDSGIWHDGQWDSGVWKDGEWHSGTWVNGNWVKGKIWDDKLKKYRVSKVSPDKCKWSLSYGL